MAKRHHSKINKNSYAGESARRTQEMQDAGMIHNDQSAIANMPQNVMIKPYPKAGYYLPEDQDDTIRGVDHQIDDLDGKKRVAGTKPKKV